MSQATDVLKQEHKEVLGKLDTFEKALEDLGDRARASRPLEELTRFFDKDFWVHFGKEEDALFPELEKFIPRNAGPIGIMLMEHEDLRRTNDEIQRAAASYLAGNNDTPNREKLQDSGRHFIAVLRDHIFKEDNILFSMADAHLDAAQAAAVLRRFAEIEKPEAGSRAGKV
ncbi:MAG: hemerythrin domain-containing protein [Chloroflexi bacterium]|nr:hemerythrin domain-containing protein [Chloroflexota bacterium]